MTEFWVSSGHHLTLRGPSGGLLVTDELILAWLARPELVPPPEACDAERALHASLLAAPRRAVAEPEIAALADPDARENWRVLIDFRDRLLAAGTIEGAYLDFARNGAAGVPALFLDQLVHLALRNALDGCSDPFVLRAAELFFRKQRVHVEGDAVLLADAEVVESHERTRGGAPLLAQLGKPAVAELDVLDDATADGYWRRSDAFSVAFNLGSSARSRAGLARAIEVWIAHLLGVAVAVEAVPEIRDRDWRWFVGLDAEATRLGNALWRGETPDPEDQSRVLTLFRLSFADPREMLPAAAGKPVYLILAMSADRMVRLKPQNLVVGLPLAERRPA